MLSVPPHLRRLLETAHARDRERAWKEFIEDHSRLVLHAVWSVAKDHDDAMDAYAYVLEQLRADDFARLRTYVADGRSKFTTWLVVVARRLALDHVRRVYGRVRDVQTDSARAEQLVRRRLRDLSGDDIELGTIAATSSDADEMIRIAELHASLDMAIETLAPADRLLLALRFDDGLSAQQIARILHFTTPFHVYHRIDAVTATLRRILGARGIESAVP